MVFQYWAHNLSLTLCVAEKSIPFVAAGLLSSLCAAEKSIVVPSVPRSPKGGTENRNW